MKIYQIVSEQNNRAVSGILRDMDKLSPQEQEVFKELVLTREKDIPRGKIKRSTDGRSFRWVGDRWVNTKSGKTADDKMRLNLSTDGKVTPPVRNLYQTAKDQDLVEPVAKELEKTSKKKSTTKSKTGKSKKTFDTGLVKAMQRATGRSGPAKDRGDDPDSWFN